MENSSDVDFTKENMYLKEIVSVENKQKKMTNKTVYKDF